MTTHYTLNESDIGKPIIHAFGQAWLTSNFIGQVLSCDVGKRVYLRSGILQVENDEQRFRRLQGELMRDR